MHLKFFKTILKHVLLYICIIFLAGFFIPATPKAKKSHLYSRYQKEKLFKLKNKNRIILVGGSNLAFGINSKKIHDSLNLFPINTSIGAGLGLDFMMNDVIEKIQKNDIVLLVPEYHHFFKDFAFGECNNGEELARMVIDVDKTALINIDKIQIKYILKYLPVLSLSKFKPNEYFLSDNKNESNQYNYFGDEIGHWYLPPLKFNIEKRFNMKELNYNILYKIKIFQRKVKQIGAKLAISFPCYQESSYNKSVEEINYIHKLFIKNNFSVISLPETFKMENQYMYDTPYHLIKKGVEIRTNHLIKDLKTYIKRYN